MSESTLQAAFRDLTGEVGEYLGYGRGADNGDKAWTNKQALSVERCVKGGLRRFYNCNYDWSFLKPVADLTLDLGKFNVPLPDDYGGLEGLIYLYVSDTQYCPIQVVPIGDILKARTQFASSSGPPEMACIQPVKGTSVTDGQRYLLQVWPTAEQEYTLRFQYYLNPDYLSGAKPYAYGGAQHAETLLAACVATAAVIYDDEIQQREAYFQSRLKESVSIDRRNKPQAIGYNGDRSDQMERTFWRNFRHDAVATINGIDPRD